MRRAVLVLIIIAAAIGAVPASAQRGATGTAWPTYGGDPGSTKYSPLDQINRDNVQRLKVAWRWESADNPIVLKQRQQLPAIPASFKATPIMVDGTLYIKTSMSQAAAIDAARSTRRRPPGFPSDQNETPRFTPPDARMNFRDASA